MVLGMTQMAQRYPLEKPQLLRDAGYDTTTIGKQDYSPMRNGHGYHRMILDEHCGCGLIGQQKKDVRAIHVRGAGTGRQRSRACGA